MMDRTAEPRRRSVCPERGRQAAGSRSAGTSPDKFLPRIEWCRLPWAATRPDSSGSSSNVKGFTCFPDFVLPNASAIQNWPHVFFEKPLERTMGIFSIFITMSDLLPSGDLYLNQPSLPTSLKEEVVKFPIGNLSINERFQMKTARNLRRHLILRHTPKSSLD